MTTDNDNAPEVQMGMVHGARLFSPEVDPDDTPEAPETAAPAEEKSGPNPDVVALQKQVETLTKQLADQNNNMMMLMAQPPAATPASAQPTPEPLPELPDVLDDPAKYAETLEKRIRVGIANEQKTSQASADATRETQQRYNALWQNFQSKYPEYADQQSRVQYAANEVAQDMQNLGVDLDTYMFRNRDRFMADVAGKMVEIFGEADPKPSNKGDKQFTNTRQRPEDPDEGRTQGIFQSQPPAARTPAADQPEKHPFEDIRKFQLDHGFY